MTFELTVLGSSSALPTSTKYPAAHVLNVHERFFLIDCGEGTQIQLRKAGIPFRKIDHIFISHIHGDHVFGLPGLLSTLNLLGRKTPLHVYGHPDLQVILDFYLNNFAAESGYEIHLHPISKRNYQKIFEDKIVEVHAFPLKHRIPCFGYHFSEKERYLNIKKDRIRELNLSIKQIQSAKEGKDVILEDGQTVKNSQITEKPYKKRAFAYCSDTAFYKKNTSYLQNTDLLYHEATFLDKDKKLAKETGHSTAAQAAEFARQAAVGKLLIGHFSNRYKNQGDFLTEAQSVFADTDIADELSKHSVARVRK